MSTYEQRDGDIAVFAVKEKKNPKGPDFTGRALIDGVEKDVSLWWKSETMLAGQVKEKWVPKEGTAPLQPAPVQEDLEDEIPF